MKKPAKSAKPAKAPKPTKAAQPSKAAQPAKVSKPKKSAMASPHEESPVISFMWLDAMHNEVPESEAIYGFGIGADGSRFVMGPRPNPVDAD